MIQGTTAPFGAPVYGERVLGQLAKGADGCLPLDVHKEMEKQDEDPDPPPTGLRGGQRMFNIVVMRRADEQMIQRVGLAEGHPACSIVSQVRYAQKTGAHAAIIIDEPASTLTPAQLTEQVVPDDGKGWKVKIPSVLVHHSDGALLLKALSMGSQHTATEIIVELLWDVPRQHTVLADLWLSAGSAASSEFMEGFKPVAETLQHHLSFQPHYHIFENTGAAWKHREASHLCRLSDSDQAVYHCAPDPDGNGPVTGAEVVMEDLRQLCIWQKTATFSDPPVEGEGLYSQTFWDYVGLLRSTCPLDGTDPSERFGEACSYKLMTNLGIDTDSIAECCRKGNSLLEMQVRDKAWSSQALQINGWRYQGALDPELVTKAICAGYAEPLAECDALMGGWFHKVAYHTQRIMEYWFTPTTFVLLSLCLVVLTVINGYLYRKHIRRHLNRIMRDEVMLEVRSQVSDYAKLSDGGRR